MNGEPWAKLAVAKNTKYKMLNEWIDMRKKKIYIYIMSRMV